MFLIVLSPIGEGGLDIMGHPLLNVYIGFYSSNFSKYSFNFLRSFVEASPTLKFLRSGPCHQITKFLP